MNLKDFLAKRDNPPELFWSVIIEDQQTQAGIWHIEADSSIVDGIGSSSTYFSDEELVTAVDATLSSAMQKLPDDSLEPKKTVFGVVSSWVADGEIKDEFIGKIKKICDELGLTPVGFVVLPEAVAHLYKAEEGVPVSAIIVGLGTGKLEISVFKLGNLIGNTTVTRSVSLSEDVIEGLTRFEGAVPLPSRFVVYDGREGDLDLARDELMQSSWDSNEKVKFLHTPKAEVLSSDRKVLAVSLAGASEMGENVNKVSLNQMSEDLAPEVVENLEPVSEVESARDLGFAVDSDVTNVSPEPVFTPPTPPTTIIKKKRISMPKLPKFNFSLTPLTILVFAVLIGIGLIFYFLPKAEISIFVTPKSYEGNFEINFDGNNSEIVKGDSEGTKTKSATGKKVIGDKAKGSVVIANGNASPIKLNAGTLLTSSAGLKFVTTKEASISGQVLPGSPGTATVDVNANDIGSQYNLGKDEVFSVGNYAKSLVAATSQGDFTGGSSREISAISKDDKELILKDLKNELIDEAKSDMEQKIDFTKMLISDYSEVTVKTEEYDHKVNDEADNLKLNLAIEVSGIVVDKVKLFEFTKEKLKEQTPSGFILRDDQIKYSFQYIKNTDNNYIFKTNVKVNYLPSVNVDEIKKQINGKSVSETTKYLNSMPSFKGAQIKFNNIIFSNIGIMPFIKNNIAIIITSSR